MRNVNPKTAAANALRALELARKARMAHFKKIGRVKWPFPKGPAHRRVCTLLASAQANILAARAGASTVYRFPASSTAAKSAATAGCSVGEFREGKVSADCVHKAIEAQYEGMDCWNTYGVPENMNPTKQSRRKRRS